ncbi:cell wall hydrolase [Bacillus sp. 1P06AnD]|uniref:cell wall hydrolase n=1 Tax=Bacillus sp. 1P06AnD TaxID=3132208 RepID=UPI0039A3CBE3
MKKTVAIILAACALLLVSIAPNHTDADSKTKSSSVKRNNKGEIIHTAKGTEKIADIAIKYGVPLEELKEKNKIKSNTIDTGKEIILPKTLASQEKDLMARLVQAEAKGEPYKGKVAVATVVLNRVDSKKFPNRVDQVIKAKGQFTPVSNGQIKKPASAESKKAVNEAIALQDALTEATFFYNPDKTNDRWIKSLPVIERIGHHNFAVSKS